MWADNYNRSLDDIFAIQAEIAREIAGQLQAALSPEEITRIERRPTNNQEAYDYYLKGRRGRDRISNLEKAVALDPGFAEAWALLGAESHCGLESRFSPRSGASGQSASSTATSKAPGSRLGRNSLGCKYVFQTRRL